jgi:hypothetical protein
VRIWWPNPPLEERDRLPRNVYENLSTALAEAKPGDDIEIRANGPVALPNTISLTRPNQRLVIKPEEGSKPILVPTLTDRIEMNLFRLEEGELRFENLEFLIRPVQIEEGDLRSATVVGFAGGRRCEFVSCVLTLDERFIEKLAVATVLESPGSIRKAETLRVPDLVMENCLIRGRGRGVLMPTAMPLNIKLTNTLIALQGSLLDLGAPSRTTPSGTAVAVTLQRVTTHIWGPIFRMSLGSSAESATWLPLEIRAEETLFVNPEDQTRPMILLRSPSEIPLERVVLWQTTGNAFANIPDSFSFLTVQRDDQEEPAQMKQPEWLKFSREKAASFGRVRFKSAPTTQVLTSIRASDFSTSERDLPPALQSTGANLATVASPTETKPSENN